MHFDLDVRRTPHFLSSSKHRDRGSMRTRADPAHEMRGRKWMKKASKVACGTRGNRVGGTVKGQVVKATRQPYGTEFNKLVSTAKVTIVLLGAGQIPAWQFDSFRPSPALPDHCKPRQIQRTGRTAATFASYYSTYTISRWRR